MGEHLCSWIKEYLTDRQQRAFLNCETSDWLPVASGVPQGSVLLPTLFIIYINDLEIDILSKVAIFADDTEIEGEVTTHGNCQKMQFDLIKLAGK